MLVAAFSSAPCVQAAVVENRRCRSSRLICRDGSQGQSPSPINEDLIARLKVAEEEVSVWYYFFSTMGARHAHIVVVRRPFIHLNLQILNYNVMQAQKLKKELAAAKSDASVSSPGEEEAVQRASKRIDSGDLRRETLSFVGKNS